jgi:hypothetical protein
MRAHAFLVTVGVLVVAQTRTVHAQACLGDFNDDHRVTVNEIIVGVNNVLNDCAPPSARFVDNGDGTIADTQTGLVWEKKSDDGSIHDQDNQYTWSATGSPQLGYWDGTVFTDFLSTLNSQAFAGHRDWGLPSLAQLETLIDRDTAFPSIDHDAFANCSAGCAVTTCSCTAGSNQPATRYWSSTPLTTDLTDAWAVSFEEGTMDYVLKTGGGYVRAVRGGFFASASSRDSE